MHSKMRTAPFFFFFQQKSKSLAKPPFPSKAWTYMATILARVTVPEEEMEHGHLICIAIDTYNSGSLSFACARASPFRQAELH